MADGPNSSGRRRRRALKLRLVRQRHARNVRKPRLRLGLNTSAEQTNKNKHLSLGTSHWPLHSMLCTVHTHKDEKGSVCQRVVRNLCVLCSSRMQYYVCVCVEFLKWEKWQMCLSNNKLQHVGPLVTQCGK